jgi:hypothetical protein
MSLSQETQKNNLNLRQCTIVLQTLASLYFIGGGQEGARDGVELVAFESSCIYFTQVQNST